MSIGHFEFDPVVWTIVVQLVLPVFAPIVVSYVIMVVTFGSFMPRLKKAFKLPLSRTNISDESIWEYFEPLESEKILNRYARRFRRG